MSTSKASVRPIVIKDDETLTKAAGEYASFLSFPELTAQQVLLDLPSSFSWWSLLVPVKLDIQHIESSLLKVMSRLDELGAVLGMAAVESEKMNAEVLPLLRAKTNELRTIFIYIERLRTLVDGYRKNLNDFEEIISKEEEKYSSLSLQKMLSVFRATAVSDLSDPKKEVHVVDSKDFFETLRSDLRLLQSEGSSSQ